MDDIEAVAALQDPVRRGLHGYVAAQDHEVSRTEAAQALGIGRTLAAHHLDRLAEAGLLEVVFRRPGGRGGPGAGRPSKLYRRADAEVVVSVPARDYALVASLLAEVAQARRLDGAVARAARRTGQEGAGGDLWTALAERGYLPVEGAAGEIRLRNCPFHRVAVESPALVCGMNLALLEGLAEGSGHTARMAAEPGWCCVALSKNNEH